MGDDGVFTTFQIGSEPRMPVCLRTSAWALVTLECLCRRRPLVLRSSKAAYHSHCSSVFQKKGAFSRVLTPFTSPGTATDVTSTLRSVCDVPVCRRISMSSTEMSQRMVWVDLEMTGLDIEKDQIIEMACIITDSDLNVLAEGPNLIIKQPDKLLEGMSEWCKEHHGKTDNLRKNSAPPSTPNGICKNPLGLNKNNPSESGLTQAVRDSKITLEQAEYEFLSFVRQHTPPGQCPLAGNSVHADKRFLDKYMPQFMYHLHYRIIDVSTIKELCRALDDIWESIKELQYYRANVFKASTEEKKIVENGGSNNS